MKYIYIDNKPYSISNRDYFKIESIQKEMQELVNQDKFKSSEYKNLKKLFTTFLQKNIKEKNKNNLNDIYSEDYFYTN